MASGSPLLETVEPLAGSIAEQRPSPSHSGVPARNRPPRPHGGAFVANPTRAARRPFARADWGSEALAFSCPLITAPVGTEGLEQGINKAYLVANEPSEFVDAIGHILTDDGLAERRSVEAHAAAESWNDAAMRELNQALEVKGNTP